MYTRVCLFPLLSDGRFLSCVELHTCAWLWLIVIMPPHRIFFWFGIIFANICTNTHHRRRVHAYKGEIAFNWKLLKKLFFFSPINLFTKSSCALRRHLYIYTTAKQCVRWTNMFCRAKNLHKWWLTIFFCASRMFCWLWYLICRHRRCIIFFFLLRLLFVYINIKLLLSYVLSV